MVFFVALDSDNVRQSIYFIDVNIVLLVSPTRVVIVEDRNSHIVRKFEKNLLQILFQEITKTFSTA